MIFKVIIKAIMETLHDNWRFHVNIIYILILCASVGNFIFSVYFSCFHCSTFIEAELRKFGYEKIKEHRHAWNHSLKNAAYNRKKRESEAGGKCEFEYQKVGSDNTELCFKYSSFEACCQEATNFFTGKKEEICPPGMKGEKGDPGIYGLPGERGPTGKDSEKGDRGEKGNSGAKGEREENGSKGEADLNIDETNINQERKDCILDRIGEPESVNYQTNPQYYNITFMVDPLRNESDEEFFIWIYRYSVFDIREYRFKTFNPGEIIYRRFPPETFKDSKFHTAVIYNGSIYGESKNGKAIVKYNMATNKIIKKYIRYNQTFIHFYADENGIWLIYKNHKAYSFIANINSENLNILSKKQVITYRCNPKRLFFAFGRIYCVNTFSWKIHLAVNVYGRRIDNFKYSINLNKLNNTKELSYHDYKVCYNYKSQYLYLYDNLNIVKPERYKLHFKCF